MHRPLLIVLAGIVGALALAGGGFVAGMTLANANAGGAGTAARQAPRLGQAPGQFAGAAQGHAVNGEVLSVGEGTLTVQVGGGQGSRIVIVAPSTRLVRTVETEVALASIKAGDRVTVVGQENADGTVDAQAVLVGGANLLQQFLGGSPRPSPGR
jgi:hypothetical protein